MPGAMLSRDESWGSMLGWGEHACPGYAREGMAPGKKAATVASKTLRDKRTGKASKSAGGSALSQTEKGKGKKK